MKSEPPGNNGLKWGEMRPLSTKRHDKNDSLRRLFIALSLGAAIICVASCAKTVSVYHPPRLDLTRYGRLGMITFTDNAQPSVANYATEQFQNQIHSAQAGIPIVDLGTEAEVLNSIGSSRLDPAAMVKIGQQYNVSAVFNGSIVYSDVETNVNLNEIAQLKASVDTILHATLSVKLMETGGGATIWSDSAAWQRKLGRLSVNDNAGLTVGTDGYNDAYRKLVPDMVHDVTGDLRGWYTSERVSD